MAHGPGELVYAEKNCKGIHGEWPPRLQSPDANPPPGVAVTNSRIAVADTLTPP